ncbi:MAG: alpha-galactosidase [Lachnospiraceae bacterium]|nr:alpha-galactosidase [Lachnospiraceae bacterium]
MSIYYDENTRTFYLNTCRTSYQMQVDEHGYLHHLYYGRQIGYSNMKYMHFYSDCGFSANPYYLMDQREFSLDNLCQEYPGSDVGDYRIGCLSLQNPDGSYSAEFRYQSHQITKGKYTLTGLPAAYDESNQAESLMVELKDLVSGLTLKLLYGVFEKENVITRSAVLVNNTPGAIVLYKAASACLDLPFGEWDLIHFQGRHCMERQLERRRLIHGIQTVGSRRGSSSHHHNPFVILASKETTEDWGECVGAMLVYSGSYEIQIEQSQMHAVRLVAGIQSQQFTWHLERGATFVMPEVLFSFSDQGLTCLSHQYSSFIQEHICRGKYQKARRPILVNNWEATYFDFNTKKLLEIAREAKDLGIEMLVLDDGWFGKRNDEKDGLGDWYVNENKLEGGLDVLIQQVNAMGMKFGIWVEPEMVSEASDLYREHPDWALSVPGRAPVMGRCQLVLDMGRKEVQDYLYGALSNLLSKHAIDYVKWDMNRNMSDIYSRVLPAERQGEASHRYMLGVYALLDRLTRAFPDVLLEGCSGGGGRFDCGMLCYSPQIWCSDDTDAVERLKIQYGTSFGYPVSAMGAHVSAVPNHQTGRSTSLKTRGITAMSGTFGYELDLTALTEEEKQEIAGQIETFKKYYDLIQWGDYYRLTNAVEDRYFTAWQFAAKDGSEALLNVVVISPQANPTPIHVRLKGLKEKAIYREENSELVCTGAALMYGGFTLPLMFGDYPGAQYHFVEEK